MKWRIAALVSQIAVLLYWAIAQWVDFFPWNDVALYTFEEKLQHSLSFSLPLLILIFTFICAWISTMRWFMLVSLAGYAYYFILQVYMWWRPFFFGASEGWMRAYLKYFSRTYKFWQPSDARPIPDAHHITLQILFLIAIMTTAIAFKTRFARRVLSSPPAEDR